MSSSESFGEKLKKAFNTELTKKDGAENVKTKLEKKTKIKIFLVILVMVLVFPIPIVKKSGDIVEYNAVLYQYRKCTETVVYDGRVGKEKTTTLKICTITVYDNVSFK